MNMSRNIIISGLLVVAAAASGNAQATATQSVGYQVDAINQIAVAGSPTLTINTAVAGSGPTSATASGSTWAVTTNQSTAKVTASININMPAGVILSATLGAPAGATSSGIQALTTGTVDMVTGITRLAASALTITYQLDATAAAGVQSGSRTVTYTITGGV